MRMKELWRCTKPVGWRRSHQSMTSHRFYESRVRFGSVPTCSLAECHQVLIQISHADPMGRVLHVRSFTGEGSDNLGEAWVDVSVCSLRASEDEDSDEKDGGLLAGVNDGSGSEWMWVWS